MTICIYCGLKMPDDARFCNECGTPVQEGSVAEQIGDPRKQCGKECGEPVQESYVVEQNEDPCKQCGKELKAHWSQCPWCETVVEKGGKCKNCGEDLEPGMVICPTCKTRRDGQQNGAGKPGSPPPAPNGDVPFNMPMTRIEAGSFTMGQHDIRAASSPHRVTITKGFYMGVHAVTQEQYQKVMGPNPSRFTGSPAPGEEQAKRPVENVNWYHAIAFCNRLSILQGLAPAYGVEGVSSADADAWLHSRVPLKDSVVWNTVTADWNAAGYRLPTEAEWEYAARAGTATQWSFGNTEDFIRDYAWCSGNSEKKTHQVGLKKPNAWGLYDVHGNVSEWCWDRYGEYTVNAETDPRGAVSGGYRVNRGGSWYGPLEFARSARRNYSYPDQRFNSLGFRVMRP